MKEISVREAVALSNYTRQAVYNLIINGRVPARKEGHEYRIDRTALLAYVQARKQARKSVA